MANQHNQDPIVVLGRALHPPWNEGTRVIGRDIARAAGALRPVRVVSLTHEQFRGPPDERLAVEHVYTRLPYGARGDYAALGRIARTVAAPPSRAHAGVAHLIGLPLALAPWLRRHGFAVVAHVPLAEQRYRGPAEQLRAALGWRCFSRWVDIYACTSEHVRAQLTRQGYPAARLRVVPPPLDIQRFRRVERAAARRALGLPADAFVVAYLGTISPLRFPAADVLRALSLADDIPDLQLAVFAPISTHPYNVAWAEGHLRRVAAGSGLPISVALRDLAEPQKVALYSAADVVLLPFGAPVAVEPPLTLLEAMACQALVAAAPAANRSEVVVDGINGALFGTPEELAAQLRRLHALGTEQRAALGAAARATVAKRHSFAAAAIALTAIWDSLARQNADSYRHDGTAHPIC